MNDPAVASKEVDKWKFCTSLTLFTYLLIYVLSATLGLYSELYERFQIWYGYEICKEKNVKNGKQYSMLQLNH